MRYTYSRRLVARCFYRKTTAIYHIRVSSFASLTSVSARLLCVIPYRLLVRKFDGPTVFWPDLYPSWSFVRVYVGMVSVSAFNDMSTDDFYILVSS